MNKKRLFLIIIVVLILLGSVFLTNTNKFIKNTKKEEYVLINDKKIHVEYLNEKKVNTKLTYNNKYSSIIEITNNNEEEVVYSLKLNNLNVSNEYVTYTLFASGDNRDYFEVSKETNLNEFLGYNLVIEGNKTLYLKVTFISNLEGEETTIKGNLEISNNITERDKMISVINSEIALLKRKIKEINGINIVGKYYSKAAYLEGYIVIDASDLADINYILYLVNDDYYIDGVNFESLKPNKILKKNDNVIYDFEKICNECINLSELGFIDNGGVSNFSNDVYNVLNLVKNDFKSKEKQIYVYDIKNDIKNPTNLEGYIVIDNTKEESEYYLYITNKVFMISGYNITVLGDFKPSSSTIRTYNNTAFDLSSSSAKVACEFSGFNNCLNKSGELLS